MKTSTKPRFIQNSIKLKKSRAQGVAYEVEVENQAHREDMALTQMPMGAKFVNSTKMVRVKTDFDFILTFRHKTALFDCKSFKGTRLTASMILDHQFNALLRHHLKGGIAGYLIFWIEKNSVMWFSAGMLQHVMLIEGLNWDNGRRLGTLSNFQLADVFEIP